MDAGVPFGPTLTWRQLKTVLPLGADGQTRPWAVWGGDLEESTAIELFDALDDDGDGPWFFGFGLSAIIGGNEHRPLLFSARSLHDLRAVIDAVQHRGATSITTAEYVWPADQRWIVCSDYDLTSTYLAVCDEMAQRLLTNDALETVEVGPETRIDDHADEQQV